MTQARWLTETVTHLFHHRTQFFTYLKQTGRDVSMDNLYV
ncbi:DinB family protein [Bacillus chungangensis]|nr:DinB family protein [Bacillus chungangensis]